MPHDELWDTIQKLMNYDNGVVDAGIRDDELKSRVKTMLYKTMSRDERRRFLAEQARDWLGDDAITEGYGIEDVAALHKWIEDLEYWR